MPPLLRSFHHLFQRTFARSIPKTRNNSTFFSATLPRNAPLSREASLSRWPATSSPSVGRFLVLSSASVFGIVVFGGLTRLTESGLSITEWRPVTGTLPPRGEEGWEREFELYRASPEFKILNSRMELDEFKKIYWMEWGHRLWGRVIGLMTVGGAVWFVARGRVARRDAWRLLGICAGIGVQGGIGWWMVKSGLKDPVGEQPRVSQYRLAAHLGTAFVVYLAMLGSGLRILRDGKMLKEPGRALERVGRLRDGRLRPFRGAVLALAGLVFVTAMSGALVAGLDAGLVYNDFPWMGQGLLPPRREMMDPLYAKKPDQSDLVWRNMFENPVMAQLDHRILATTTFCAVLGLWAFSKRPHLKNLLPRDVQKAVLGTVHLVTLQVCLGITTLWYLVPTPLAAAHQAGALALLTGVFVLAGRMTVPKRTVKLLEAAVKSRKL
ncbi:putative cytochrome c oxidase assembly protein [Piedraia hortae CBS 480.64]|uniref:Putative cytochrome c oxidase assembly protein n=1 Tax=Piedraia hortae CBS 480.64 TaxID=1314780 RepID=A0A6A7C0N4_9PEZI|nr:putative cytochrome c oxidase assembly protein [Piedraia hortae CBS 480.64]